MFCISTQVCRDRTHFKRQPKLEGFAVPSYRSLEGALTSGLVPLEEEMIGLRQKKTKLCSFQHLLNLLRLPILDYIKALDRQAVEPDWTRSLDFHQAAIASEMRGLVPGHEEAMDMDQWYVFVQETLQRLLSVHVPTRLIKQVLSPMVPLNVLAHGPPPPTFEDSHPLTLPLSNHTLSLRNPSR